MIVLNQQKNPASLMCLAMLSGSCAEATMTVDFEGGGSSDSDVDSDGESDNGYPWGGAHIDDVMLTLTEP